MAKTQKQENNAHYQGAFLDHLLTALNERGMWIKDLAEMVDITSEHARRMVRGISPPSRPVLRLMAQKFKWNFEEMEKLAAAATIRKKYGDVLLEMAGKNPEMEAIENVWHLLTEGQKKDATSMIVGWAKGNK